jgi:hypothetical protein
MTGEYTFVAPERQNELTRRIQKRLAQAVKNGNGKAEAPPQPPQGPPDAPPNLSEMKPVTTVPQ